MINNIYFSAICITLVYLFWIYLGIRWYAHLNKKYNKNSKIAEWPLFRKDLIYGGFVVGVNYFVVNLLDLNYNDNNLTFFAAFLMVISAGLNVAQVYFYFKKYE